VKRRPRQINKPLFYQDYHLAPQLNKSRNSSTNSSSSSRKLKSLIRNKLLKSSDLQTEGLPRDRPKRLKTARIWTMLSSTSKRKLIVSIPIFISHYFTVFLPFIVIKVAQSIIFEKTLKIG
jgi:hypothetical protein